MFQLEHSAQCSDWNIQLSAGLGARVGWAVGIRAIVVAAVFVFVGYVDVGFGEGEGS
jgi:hypothetical protein